jgi:hypothetical protein
MQKAAVELLTRQTRKIAHRVTFPLPFSTKFLCKAEKAKVRYTRQKSTRTRQHNEDNVERGNYTDKQEIYHVY